MKNSNDEKKHYESIDILKETFSNINNWLIFAETKNGVLLGINGLYLFKLLEYLTEDELYLSSFNTIGIWILIVIFLCAIIVTLKSFFPNYSMPINKNYDIYKDGYGRSRNLIFYRDISRYESPYLYLQDIYIYYLNMDIDKEDLSKYELDYADEIIINSRIACYKYRCFKQSLTLNGLGIFLFMIFHFIVYFK